MNIKTELTPDELNVLIQALDAYVRTNGLQVTRNAALVHQKLQEAAQESAKLEKEPA